MERNFKPITGPCCGACIHFCPCGQTEYIRTDKEHSDLVEVGYCSLAPDIDKDMEQFGDDLGRWSTHVECEKYIPAAPFTQFKRFAANTCEAMCMDTD